MVTLKRDAPPHILVDKGTEWRDKYLEAVKRDAKKRPSTDRYGHSEVREELRRMGNGKCFYCEQELSEETEEVDHYIEVREHPSLAFEWRNLYLSCGGCNKKKIPNLRLPVNDCVDPCESSQPPAEHLYFNKEKIKPHSERGKETIRKYRLDRTVLSLQRSKFLNQFADVLERIHEAMIAEGRRDMTIKERALIQGYRDSSQPFSLMMSARLAGKILRNLYTSQHPSAGRVRLPVDDVARKITDLEERGVGFEAYDQPGLKTESGIATGGGAKSAWFKDTEGNIFAIAQSL